MGQLSPCWEYAPAARQITPNTLCPGSVTGFRGTRESLLGINLRAAHFISSPALENPGMLDLACEVAIVGSD
jgi:hypothetical protein